MNIEIRTATSNDLDQIAELFNSYRVFYGQDSDIELAKSFLSERLDKDESVIFYALAENGEPLGFTQLYPFFSSVSAKRVWVLNDLFVKSNARRLGAAKALMLAAKELAIQTNAKGISLETGMDNDNAQALYESLGYEKSTGVYNYFLNA